MSEVNYIQNVILASQVKPKVQTLCKSLSELGPVLHRSQILTSELIHFVHQTQYYIMFEATECTWGQLMDEVTKARDLDEVILAHENFLDAIDKRCLLDASKQDLLNQLRKICTTVDMLQAFLEKFENVITSEMKGRGRSPLVVNTPGYIEAQKEFFVKYVSPAKEEIESLYETTQVRMSLNFTVKICNGICFCRT